MDAPREKEHLLSLKVMRLTKPSFVLSCPVICEQQDIFSRGSDGLQDLLPKLGSVQGLPAVALGELLTLPQNFGSIYLGETFSCYVSVHNDSSQIVKDILVKTDLQTSSQRLALSGSGATPRPELEPEGCIDEVIQHEVKELGTHILVCAVNYNPPSGDSMYFRKFFKFQVLKPLDVKTKFYSTEDNLVHSDEVYLEAQIQNITQSPMCIEKVSLEPAPEYTVTELNLQPDDSDSSIFGAITYVNPMDTRQYLYRLQAKPQQGSERGTFTKGVSSIGKLDIVWKTNLGERGRLQTSPLQRVSPGCGDIKLVVLQIPDSITLQSSFKFLCKLTSCCERTMDLKLNLQKAGTGLSWMGISGKQLGKLGPGDSLQIELSMLSTIPGLQSISGLRIIDQNLKRTYEHDDIAQIFVHHAQTAA
ncbi:trafficking protein particle complex subunit 13-like isoform X2 [Apostichopus japonicus]|uniref:trafficking protein particle complex subunit 13-like isoform X2 n=1 Tax=Stichopus japonicus TaxID=307972 RepID=UPI003AB71E14